MLPVGNKKIAERIKAFATGKIPHAILIEGENGIGKHTLARHIASIAVCTGATPPCGECRGCHLSQVGTHPDISVCSPDGKSIKVDQIRSLRQNAYLKPTLCERKVYIIEGAETMNSAAQNALLKVLEEPPEGVIFILLALSAASMLQTVRSRCITLSLVPPQRDEAAEYISSVAHFTAAEIDSALEQSKNNIGMALSLLNNRQENEFALLARQLLLDINGSSAVEMLSRLKKYEKDRAAVDKILSELSLRIAELLKESCYTHIREGLSREKLVSLYETVADLREKSASNVNIMLLFTNLCSSFRRKI